MTLHYIIVFLIFLKVVVNYMKRNSEILIIDDEKKLQNNDRTREEVTVNLLSIQQQHEST